MLIMLLNKNELLKRNILGSNKFILLVAKQIRLDEGVFIERFDHLGLNIWRKVKIYTNN